MRCVLGEILYPDIQFQSSINLAGPRGHRSKQGGAPGTSLHISSGEVDGSSKREIEMGRWQADQGDH